MLDALGLPDSMGDMIGAQIDMASGDMAGFARNMMDLTSGMSTGALDSLFGKGLVQPHFAPSPLSTFGKGQKLWGQKFFTPFGTQEISRHQLGPKGLFGKMIGRSMERALQNPAFKARMEQLMGGRIVNDGRMDGRITVQRFTPSFPGVPLSKAISTNPMLSGIYGSISRMQGNMNALMGQMVNQGANKSGGTAQAALTNGDMGKTATEMGMSPPMSFEDVLFLLMLKYAKNKEKQILDKSQELLRKSEKSQADGKKYDGIAQGVEKQYGSTKTAQEKEALTKAAAGKQGLEGYDPMNAKQSDATDQAVLQKMMNDLQKVYQLLTNVMKSMHDMQMAAVRNIR